jgi:glycosyltransferase involved in cell wall biosynthesis
LGHDVLSQVISAESGRPELSIVVPCYNEQDNVEAMYEALTAEAAAAVGSYEIIFIDNKSSDRTRQLLREICERDDRVRAILNNRNYGQMRSPTYAIYQAKGRAVLALCCDFQDPPTLIPQMVAQWRAGAQIVLGQRRSEKAGLVLSLVRRTGYAFFRRFGDYPLIPGATGFGLYSREVVDELAKWNEPEPFFRGMLVESGFRMAVIPYDRPQRTAGASSNNYGALLNFALSGVGGSAKGLLRLQLILAIYLCLFAGVLAIATTLRFIFHGYSPALLILTFVVGLFAVMLLSLGLIGDQVRLLAERSRNVPLVIEEERLNFEEKPLAVARKRVAQNS